MPINQGNQWKMPFNNAFLRIEQSLDGKEMVLGAFLDIQGAFDKLHYDSITSAVEKFKLTEIITNYIMSILKNRFSLVVLVDSIQRASSGRSPLSTSMQHLS